MSSWYTLNLYHTKIGLIFSEGQSLLHHYCMQSLLKCFQRNFQVKSVKICADWIRTYYRIEFLAFRRCNLIGYTFLWLFWFLRYGYWTDFQNFAQMREKRSLTAWDHKNTPKCVSLTRNAWDLESLLLSFFLALIIVAFYSRDELYGIRNRR